MSNTDLKSLDIQGILKHLPHRYPFLLIDRVTQAKPGDYLIGLKNVTFNEPYFVGHFPQGPVMPGVLIIESIAQATGVLSFLSMNTTPDDESIYFLVGVDKVRFRRTVVPGDQLKLKVSIIKVKGNFWRFAGEASVDGERVCNAEFLCAYQKLNLDS